ncbi:oxidoreductase [Xenorhabdus mauleonii]|uniref:Oxidoreductase n=1 Tax=Xenorhabdus mauleonii TaxID=351675 RepID=A0A1I3KGC3_9GAMM|nr:flavin reductase family protein [Xenorhabdus mauleonii]PHM45039.1 oxidoreductase [Xenorhabdus mauleonii]SFI71390.1 NADH-FMN oxidoreductase RutF, flavin reductase (DIM6/NTAB) family [Xenorhabdus mauleonii]
MSINILNSQIPGLDCEWGITEFESRTLRAILGNYPTGVAVVATRTSDGRNVGLTINSFASLSLEPPLILWSLVNHSPNLRVFRDCEYFTVSILGCEHQDLALRFANPRVENKFQDIEVQETPEGIPSIGGAIATLVCTNHQQTHLGDHLLMIGQVRRVASIEGRPLVFHGGMFTALHDMREI